MSKIYPLFCAGSIVDLDIEMENISVCLHNEVMKLIRQYLHMRTFLVVVCTLFDDVTLFVRIKNMDLALGKLNIVCFDRS